MLGIFAVDYNWGVAKDGRIPWPFFKEDKDHFRDKTRGSVLLCGRKTFDTLPGRPLGLDRTIVLATRSSLIRDAHLRPDVRLFHGDLESWARQNIYAMCIGGVDILQQVWPQITTLYLTIIKRSYACDQALPPEVIADIVSKFGRKVLSEGMSDAGPYQIMEFTRLCRSVVSRLLPTWSPSIRVGVLLRPSRFAFAPRPRR